MKKVKANKKKERLKIKKIRKATNLQNMKLIINFYLLKAMLIKSTIPNAG